AEDGIRDRNVTGVQTCALPIFTDITRGSGLDVEMYGIGGAAADFDNDGKVDVYLTALGGNRLFRNLGGGHFVDVTAKSGVQDGEIGRASCREREERKGGRGRYQ